MLTQQVVVNIYGHVNKQQILELENRNADLEKAQTALMQAQSAPPFPPPGDATAQKPEFKQKSYDAKFAAVAPKLDGKLDDEAWVNAFPSATVRLRELQTGRAPTFGATVKAAWRGHDLYFAIRCDERLGEKLNVTSTKREDPALWYGDCVEIHLATDVHNYYQIAVNPAGALIDYDRSVDKASWSRWDSQAEAAAS